MAEKPAPKKTTSSKTSGSSKSSGAKSRTKNEGEFQSSSDVKTAIIEGITFGRKAVQYAVVDGMAIFEGDIVLGPAEEVEAATKIRQQEATTQVMSGVVRSGAQYRWPDCKVPYEIDSGLTNQARVTDAIAHWETNTQYRFIERNSSNAGTYPDYVVFRSSSGCSSAVGRQGGRQNVNLGSGCSKGNVIHEIGHVVGLWHEQSREDRDSFVTINWAKIKSGFEHNFNQHISDGDDVGAYDYGSIMHYPRTAFSKDGSETITPVDPNANIGQRSALSAGDIAAANSLCPVVKHPALDPVAKNPVTDPVVTVKETTKDVMSDTRKEITADPVTRKELIADPITRKEMSRDPIFTYGSLLGFLSPLTQRLGRFRFRDMPFAMATPHQAPGAGQVGGGQFGAGDPQAWLEQLGQQLEAIADAIAQTDEQRAQLEQQYAEIAAALDQMTQGGYAV